MNPYKKYTLAVAIMALATIAIIEVANAGPRWLRERTPVVELTPVTETCPLSQSELMDIGTLEQLPRACYGEFSPVAEYDIMSFECVGGFVKAPLGDQNSENINPVIFKANRPCIGTIGLLLSERFTVLQGIPGSRVVFQRRVLVVDKIEPPVFYWQLID